MALPVAFAGLRKILHALGEVSPEAVQGTLTRNPAVWNRLFPGAVEGGPGLSDLALTPSERRLHRESEQVFWVLNTAAQAIVKAIADSGRPLVLRNAGECDLVSLRALMRAVEWSRIDGVSGELVLAEWSHRRQRAARLFERRHHAYLGALGERMRARVEGAALEPRPVERPLEPVVDDEGVYLHAVADSAGAERSLAAAILAIRACFFSSNYEGAMFAAGLGLELLDALGPKLDEAAVAKAWTELDSTRLVTPAIEVDRSSLGDADELRALLHRQIGVVHVFTGEHEAALEAFHRGLEMKLTPERRGQLRMFRALTLIKRLGNLDRARAEIEDGLQGMRGRNGHETQLHEGWLRNVYALTYFQEKALAPALEQERLAMKCVGSLHDPSATHLKINLISNVSVLHEAAKQFSEAISTWRRFEKISANWGQNFFKHHSYRLAGLFMLAGDHGEAVKGYSQAYESAESLGDPFHRQWIAAELGRLFSDQGNPEESRRWFERAVEGARAIGDPLRLAESLAGLSLTGGNADLSEARRLAGETTTWPDQGQRLAGALAQGPEAFKALLPKPRTKLNRPFDLVNL